MKVRVVINEQHKLLPSQEAALNSTFGKDWVVYAIPAEGLDRETMSRLLSLWHDECIAGPWARIVFASPIPYLLAFCAADENIGCWFFHNDHRVAKEVPDGKGGTKIIHVLAPDGWDLVYVGLRVAD